MNKKKGREELEGELLSGQKNLDNLEEIKKSHQKAHCENSESIIKLEKKLKKLKS